jgi:hypothetical protein
MYIGHTCSRWPKLRISGVSAIMSLKNWLSCRCSIKPLAYMVPKWAFLYSQELTSWLYHQQFKSSPQFNSQFFLNLLLTSPKMATPCQAFWLKFCIYFSSPFFRATRHAHLSFVKSKIFLIMALLNQWRYWNNARTEPRALIWNLYPKEPSIKLEIAYIYCQNHRK